LKLEFYLVIIYLVNWVVYSILYSQGADSDGGDMAQDLGGSDANNNNNNNNKLSTREKAARSKKAARRKKAGKGKGSRRGKEVDPGGNNGWEGHLPAVVLVKPCRLAGKRIEKNARRKDRNAAKGKGDKNKGGAKPGNGDEAEPGDDDMRRSYDGDIQ
jgi:hypothetical protein